MISIEKMRIRLLGGHAKNKRRIDQFSLYKKDRLLLGLAIFREWTSYARCVEEKRMWVEGMCHAHPP